MQKFQCKQMGAHEHAAAQTFQYPPSVQGDLFNYLKPDQQEFVKPILRVLKKSAQAELCSSLLDYLEQGTILPPTDALLSVIFDYIINHSTIHRL